MTVSHIHKDAKMVKLKFKSALTQLYSEFYALFLHKPGQKKSDKFKINLAEELFCFRNLPSNHLYISLLNTLYNLVRGFFSPYTGYKLLAPLSRIQQW